MTTTALRPRRSRWRAAVAGLAVATASLTAAACGGDTDGSDPGTGTIVDPDERLEEEAGVGDDNLDVGGGDTDVPEVFPNEGEE